MGVISRRTFCQRQRDWALGNSVLPSQECSGERNHGASPIPAAPGREGETGFGGNTAPMALKQECPTKAIPMEVCRIGSWAGSVVVQQGPKSQSAHFPKPPARSRGEGSGPAPPASIYPGISLPNSAGAPGQGICLWNETG